MKRYSAWRAIVPATILATVTAAHAQSVGYSPGAPLDQQSWEEFIRAVSPAGNQLRFETWKTDAETFPSQATGVAAAAQPSRFQASILGLAHMPNGLRSGELRSGGLLPATCLPA